MRFYGTKGTLDADRAEFSGGDGRGPDKPPDGPRKLTFEPNPKHPHIRNFRDCMRSRQTPNALIDHKYQHMVTFALPRDALYAGCRLRFDAKTDRIV